VIIGMLDRERSELSSCETNLNTREAALEADQKSLADLKANHPAFSERASNLAMN
jgi:hypothetical protein